MLKKTGRLQDERYIKNANTFHISDFIKCYLPIIKATVSIINERNF